MIMKSSLVVASFLLAGNIFAANIWYADANKADDTGDGKSPETARRHIQSLIDDESVVDGDTIVVLPGTYDHEVTTDANDYPARVYVNKSLTIKGLDGRKGDTHIVGVKGNTATGIGEGAARAISVNADNVVIEGLTIRDGYAPATSAYGGGVKFKNDTNWLIDCTVSNCVAYCAGAMAYGIAVRSLFAHNMTKRPGSEAKNYGVVARNATMLNCLVVRNSGSNCLFYFNSMIVNCTVANNEATSHFTSLYSSPQVYNTIMVENSQKKFIANSSNPQAIVSNCLFTAGSTNYNMEDAAKTCNTNAPAYGFCAPALDDFRPTSLSGADGLGDPAFLEKVPMPQGREDLRYIDFTGKEIPRESRITAGCHQEKAGVAPAFKSETDASWECEGCGWGGWHTGSYVHFTNRVEMCKIRRSDIGPADVVWYEDASSGNVYVPDTNGWIGIYLPSDVKDVSLKTRKPTKTIWVDGQNGDDAYDGSDIGSEAHPYKTIQPAIDSVPNGTSGSNIKYSIIRVKPGVYTAKDGETGVVRIPDGETWWYRRVRILAEKGPENTIIDGLDSCRCVRMANPSAIQGFTLTRGKSEDVTEGGAFHATASVFTYYAVDCIITNNINVAAVQRGGTTIRCRFDKNNNSAVVNGRSVGSVIRASTAFAGNTGQAYFCTIEANAIDNSNYVYGGCIFKRDENLTFNKARVVGCFAHGMEINGAGVADCSSGDARFIRGGTDGNYGLYSNSQAIGTVGLGLLDSLGPYARLDFAGNTFNVVGSGVTPGAWQYPSIVRGQRLKIIVR